MLMKKTIIDVMRRLHVVDLSIQPGPLGPEMKYDEEARKE